MYIKLLLIVLFLLCDEGKFGRGCNELCGNCMVDEMLSWQCHHVNGYCLSGCNPGFYGDRCLQRNFISHCIIGKLQILHDVYQYV